MTMDAEKAKSKLKDYKDKQNKKEIEEYLNKHIILINNKIEHACTKDLIDFISYNINSNDIKNCKTFSLIDKLILHYKNHKYNVELKQTGDMRSKQYFLHIKW